MIIKEISVDEYCNFVEKEKLKSFYQSTEWYNFKKLENKELELLGLFKDNSLVGASIVIYSKILKKFKMAYASRGFIYDYSDILDFKKALLNYFKKKKVIFFRMDPPIILASYDHQMNKTLNKDSSDLIDNLKQKGFIHYGYNLGYETMQFRFIHRIDVNHLDMNKSTKKNIEIANFRGVKIRETKNLDEVLKFFELTSKRKDFTGLSKSFYLKLLESFPDNIKLYVSYIDSDTYINNLKIELNNLEKQKELLIQKKEHDHVGKKLKQEESIINNKLNKYQSELEEASLLNDYKDIASILSITKYDEVVAFASGMDNNYRKFNPKYVMYPTLINDAIKENKTYVNFLGVKNIFDKDDPDYGIYEVKRGFGGETIEYIGEFDLPINKFVYRLYKLLKK